MVKYTNLIKKTIIPSHVISETVDFLSKVGMKGYEGRVYWIGNADNSDVHISRIAIPEQIARKTFLGVNVTIPQSSNIKISRELKPGEYIVVKVHSHPRRAYNSDVDKDNPFLRHEGSISIIVPNYGRTGMNKLSNCVVAVFAGGQWNDLTPNEINEYFSFE